MRNEDRVLVMGPCVCKGCGESVFWDGMGWRNDSRGAEHGCPNRLSRLASRARAWDNDAAGTSSQSVTIATDADSLLVPGESASLRSRQGLDA